MRMKNRIFSFAMTRFVRGDKHHAFYLDFLRERNIALMVLFLSISIDTMKFGSFIT